MWLSVLHAAGSYHFQVITQIISMVASKILLQLFETLGIQEIIENYAHLVKDEKPSIFFPFSYLRKAFISAIQWM